MFGVEVTQISVLYFISYMSAADSLKSLIEATENTAQEYKIVVRSNRHEHKRRGEGGGEGGTYDLSQQGSYTCTCHL